MMPGALNHSIIFFVTIFMQYIKFYFGPYPKAQSGEDYAMQQVGTIKEVLWKITSIEHMYWENYNSWFEIEQNTGEKQPVIEFEIQAETGMVAKIASFKQLLEYDNTETFKAMFNEMIQNQYDEWMTDESTWTYMTRVDDDYFSDMDSWSRYLTLESIFDESSSMNSVGGGVLYVMMDGIAKTFCNDTVCDSHYLLNSNEIEYYTLIIYTVGMGGNSSGLPHGTIMFCSDLQSFTSSLVPLQMGYEFGVSLPGGFYGLEDLEVPPSMMYSNVQCGGGESSIFDCMMDINKPMNDECCADCYNNSVALYCSRFC